MKIINILRNYLYSHDSFILTLPVFFGLLGYNKGYFDMMGLIVFGLASALIYMFRDNMFGGEFKNKKGVFKPGVDWTVSQNIVRGIIFITFIIGFVLPFLLFDPGKMSYETFSDNNELILVTFFFKAICVVVMLLFALAMIFSRSDQRGIYVSKLVLTEDEVIAFGGVKKHLLKYPETNCDEIAENLISLSSISKSNNILLDLNIFKKKERELIRSIICEKQKY